MEKEDRKQIIRFVHIVLMIFGVLFTTFFIIGFVGYEPEEQEDPNMKFSFGSYYKQLCSPNQSVIYRFYSEEDWEDHKHYTPIVILNLSEENCKW